MRHYCDHRGVIVSMSVRGRGPHPEFKQWECTVELNVYIQDMSLVRCAAELINHIKGLQVQIHNIIFSDFQDLIFLLINILIH